MAGAPTVGLRWAGFDKGWGDLKWKRFHPEMINDFYSLVKIQNLQRDS